MSEGIKKMLAERAALTKKPETQVISGELFQMIDKAAPFMDEGTPPNEWRASDKLKIAFCLGTTGTTGFKKSTVFVLKMLQRARERWVAGLHPNPWTKEPQPLGQTGSDDRG